MPVRRERGGVPQGPPPRHPGGAAGTPATVTSDLCRGRPEIAELKRLRDCSEAVYKASQEAINVYKLRIRMVDAQITRVWNSGNVTQGGYL